MTSEFTNLVYSIDDSIRSFFENFPSTGNQTSIAESSTYFADKAQPLNDAILPLRELFDSIGISYLFQSISQLDLTAQVLLLGVGVIIFLGVGGEAFFRRTGIPDVAFLMFLGVLLGPVMGIVDQGMVLQVVPYFAALALIIIMFDGGLNLDIRKVIRTAHFSLLLSILGFAVSVLLVTLLAVYGLGWQLLDSILLGSIVGGSSSIIVFGLIKRLHVSEETKSMLGLESATTDILATIAAFLLFDTVISGQFDLNLIGITAAKAIAVGLILGFGVGIPWMYITTRLSNTQHSYMLTLGILFVLFFMANAFGESGALTALVFGLMIGNKHHLSKYLRFKLPEISAENSFHEQLTFLVRVFFFIFVGLLASFGQIEYLIFGVVAAVVIYIGRIGVTKVSLTKRFSLLDRKVTSVMIPRGLAAAVLATFPLTLGLPNAEAYPQIVFVIIMASVIITTIGLSRARKIPDKSSIDTDVGAIKYTD